MLRAYRSRRRLHAAGMLVFTAMVLWLMKHIIAAISVGSASGYVQYYWVYLTSFIALLVTIIMSYFNNPIEAPLQNDNHYITVVVPAYNEDELLLKDCLQSMFLQSRVPNAIYVVDDGSTKAQYDHIQSWFYENCAQYGVNGMWHKKENGGKRHAQAVAFSSMPETTIYVTVDSDSVLDKEAIHELLKPFADNTVQSVAGVVLAHNNRVNVLARITDLLFVTGQLVDRSMMSSVGSVLVNSGGLAAYRASVINDNLQGYLSETFHGKHIEFSDDSMLTLYALSKGKTLQQPTAFAFTMMPSNLHHHIRQQVRWSKGSFIRSWWRLKYLPVTSFGFLRQVTGWMQFAMTTTVVFIFFILRPIQLQHFSPFMLLTPLLLCYGLALRYFTVVRSDETFRSQLLTYALTPLAFLWSYFVLRPIRLYAMATCLNNAWGTRTKVEVQLDGKKLQYAHAHWSLDHMLYAARYSFAVLIYKSKRRMLKALYYTKTRYYRQLLQYIIETAHNEEERTIMWNIAYEQCSPKRRATLWRDYAALTKLDSHLLTDSIALNQKYNLQQSYAL